MRKNRLLGIMAIALMGGTVMAACDDDDDIDDLDDVVDQRIDDLDLDGDTFITHDEWNNAFTIWDTDNDRVLTVNEFRFNGAGFAAADLNGDQIVTEDEFEQVLDSWDL